MFAEQDARHLERWAEKKMNSGSAGSAHAECVSVEESTHCVITAKERRGKDEMLHAVDVPWRATETSLQDSGLNGKRKGSQPTGRKERIGCKGHNKGKQQRHGDGTLGKIKRRMGKH